MNRTVLTLALCAALAAPAAAAPGDAFQPTGTVSTRHTAKAAEFYTGMYACYEIIGTATKFLTAEVAAPVVRAVRAIATKPKTGEQLWTAVRGVIIPTGK